MGTWTQRRHVCMNYKDKKTLEINHEIVICFVKWNKLLLTIFKLRLSSLESKKRGIGLLSQSLVVVTKLGKHLILSVFIGSTFVRGKLNILWNCNSSIINISFASNSSRMGKEKRKSTICVRVMKRTVSKWRVLSREIGLFIWGMSCQITSVVNLRTVSVLQVNMLETNLLSNLWKFILSSRVSVRLRIAVIMSWLI